MTLLQQEEGNFIEVATLYLLFLLRTGLGCGVAVVPSLPESLHIKQFINA